MCECLWVLLFLLFAGVAVELGSDSGLDSVHDVSITRARHCAEPRLREALGRGFSVALGSGSLTQLSLGTICGLASICGLLVGEDVRFSLERLSGHSPSAGLGGWIHLGWWVGRRRLVGPRGPV